MLSEGLFVYNYFNLKFFAFSSAALEAILLSSLAFYDIVSEIPNKA